MATNRLTAVLDAAPGFNAGYLGYSDLEYLLFDRKLSEEWWNSCFERFDLTQGAERYDVLALFCSLLAQLTDEELSEYINSYKVEN